MPKTLYERISSILGRDCPALGGVSGEAISVIREMEDRLEQSNQLFQDICGEVDIDSAAHGSAFKGTYVADSVADYLPSKGSGNDK